MKITEESKTYKEALNEALVTKIIDMMSAYITDTGTSPIISLGITEITFEDDFQKELERVFVDSNEIKFLLIKELIHSSFG